MKCFPIVAVLAVVLLACASSPQNPPALETRPWHISPDPSLRSDTAYPWVRWGAVLKLHAGMSAASAEALTGTALQWFHHPINAILYTRDPSGRAIEVALRLSDPKDVVLDTSFKVLPNVAPVASP